MAGVPRFRFVARSSRSLRVTSGVGYRIESIAARRRPASVTNHCQRGRDGRRRRAARRVSPSTRTDARHLTRLRCNVVNDIVRTSGITAYAGRDPIEPQPMAGFPSNVVIRARRIAAHPNRADQNFLGIVKRQASAEYIHAANFAAHHGIVGLTVVGRVPTVGDVSTHRVTCLQTIQASSGLHRGI